MSKFLLEGIDFLGKSSLAKNIQKRLGFHQVMHCGKPIFSSVHAYAFQYQRAAFSQLFRLLNEPNYNFIFDRAHLGECVYAPLYRHYSGEYVFELEATYNMGHDDRKDTTLILLTEDFSCSKHFIDDGQSFDISKRDIEQRMFVSAFEKSVIQRKKIICVTDKSTGGFRSFDDITDEVLA